MDMSKLPRLSQTDAPPPPDAPPPAPAQPVAARPVTPYDARAGGGLMNAAEAWIALIVGVIFTYLGRQFGSYLLSQLFHKPFHTHVNWSSGPLLGQEVAYPQLEGHTMINDGAMFIFGIAMLLDAAVIATAYASPRLRRPLLAVALFMTTTAVVINIFVAGVFFKDGLLPLFSLLAVAIGGYSAMLQWAAFKTVPPPRARTSA